MNGVNKATVTKKPAKPLLSLEQQRARYAWQCVQGCTKDYTNLTKGAPALIMSNGLMQTLAFYQAKGGNHHCALNRHLQQWLAERFPALQPGHYEAIMQGLFNSEDSSLYRRATDETLALLRWLRQFAAAR